MEQSVTVRIRMAWWVPVVIFVLAPFGRLGLTMPDAVISWIADKAAKVEVI